MVMVSVGVEFYKERGAKLGLLASEKGMVTVDINFFKSLRVFFWGLAETRKRNAAGDSCGEEDRAAVAGRPGL